MRVESCCSESSSITCQNVFRSLIRDSLPNKDGLKSSRPLCRLDMNSIAPEYLKGAHLKDLISSYCSLPSATSRKQLEDPRYF